MPRGSRSIKQRTQKINWVWLPPSVIYLIAVARHDGVVGVAVSLAIALGLILLSIGLRRRRAK